MHDELPAPRTDDELTADPTEEASDDRRDRSDTAPAADESLARSGDGVDPPGEDASVTPDSDVTHSPETAVDSNEPDGAEGGDDSEDEDDAEDDNTGADNDAEDDNTGADNDAEDDCDEEPLAYRLERLRLWRTLATLAVVVARLIRSL